MKEFVHKLRRRGVIKVGIAYLVISWLIMQLADVTFTPLHLPEWTVTLVLVLLISGFPIALVLAWAYEMTPMGVRREPTVPATNAQPKKPEPPTTVDEISIAVLPFANMSTDEEQVHFCDGLTEELLNVLARQPNLRVASRTSCFAFKGKSVDLATIADKLHVAHILEGSVRKSGNNIRITAQLVEVASDSHLWSETYDRQLDDIFSIQDDIASRILNALKLKLGTQHSRYITTSNSLAYEYFLRGSGYASSKGSKNQELAIKLFQDAVAIDPGFVRAWVKLAQSAANFAMFSSGGARCLVIAAEAGKKAVELDPNYAESYVALGYGHLANKQYALAEVELFKAVKLNPKLASAYHLLARSAYFQGQMEKTIKYFNKSMELDPDDYESAFLVAPIYEKFGDDENALRISKIGIDRVKRHLENYPDHYRAYYLGCNALVRTGDTELAKNWADHAYKLAPDDVATRYNLACFYSKIGQKEKALDFLENSISNRIWIENDPDLEPLHDDPRFQAVLDGLSA